MTVIKTLWASVQGDPVFMRRVNGWLTIFWVLMIPVSIVTGWISEVVYVSVLSLWALVSGHWSAWQAARVEVVQQEAMRKAEEDPVEERVWFRRSSKRRRSSPCPRPTPPCRPAKTCSGLVVIPLSGGFVVERSGSHRCAALGRSLTAALASALDLISPSSVRADFAQRAASPSGGRSGASRRGWLTCHRRRRRGSSAFSRCWPNIRGQPMVYSQSGHVKLNA